MRAFRGFAIVRTVTLIAVGILILYDPFVRGSATAPDALKPGSALFSMALTLLFFISRPAVK
jgi:hypothetical protein